MTQLGPKQNKPGSPWFFDLERWGLHIPTGYIKGVMLSPEFWHTTKTANYTADKEMVILVDASSGNVTITLPVASTSPHSVYYIKKIDTTSHTVTVKGNAPAETIDGETSFEISIPYTCITPLCDGSDWWII